MSPITYWHLVLIAGLCAMWLSGGALVVWWVRRTT